MATSREAAEIVERFLRTVGQEPVRLAAVIKDQVTIAPMVEEVVERPVPKKPPQRVSTIIQAGAMSSKRWITELEVEALYGFPVRTLQDWRYRGEGPPYRKFRSAARYQIAALEVWIDGRPLGGEGVPASALKRRRT